jgi:aspartate carbamoyltransferase catalytic subunit
VQTGFFTETEKGYAMPNPLYRQHVISIADLSTEQLELVLHTALKLKAEPRGDLLKGKLIGSCFFEPSTRTRLSFETAVQRLGGKVIGFADGANTSAKKGETLADTARIISSYTDAIIQRHHKDGAARVLAEFSEVPVINAGDGTNQHPSQTLLDLVTIYETQGSLSGLKIAMCGDLKYGRTVHSLAQALKRWGCEFAFVSPPTLAMPDYITEELEEAGCAYQILPTLEDAVEWADILYMTRVQRERFDEQEFAKIQGKFNLDAAMLAKAKANLRILHPLPRVDEIHPDVDATPFAYYFQQAANGVYARQAILSLVLNEEV